MTQLYMLILILFLFLTKISYGQWIQQNSPTTINLNAVKFQSEHNGIAVGGNGIILKTMNGGENWQIVEIDTTITFLTVDFVNDYMYSSVVNLEP